MALNTLETVLSLHNIVGVRTCEWKEKGRTGKEWIGGRASLFPMSLKFSSSPSFSISNTSLTVRVYVLWVAAWVCRMYCLTN